MYDSVCEYLEWDSAFFGRRIARVTREALGPEMIAPLEAWCRSRRIECLYLLARADDAATVAVAEDSGFRLTDVRVTLEAGLGGAAPGGAEPFIRPHAPEDLPDLRALARVSHRDTRFYFDPNFPTAACDALYEAWIENSCRGWADAVLVASAGPEVRGPAGYITCHRRDADEGQIGLLAVAANCQGKGLGGALVGQALRWLAEQGGQRMRVMTQARNVRALRLYQRCGFLPERVDLWYHRWFAGNEAS